ncbi:hypothetical protein [Hyphomonas oceanitis]|uniref:hypothetical protein n=1 Tax=Hyphomonas oceanitis TaxID=81033 RepID=UPI003002F733
MTILSINYDLRKPTRNYDDLYKAIKGISGHWAHPLESFWLVKTTKTSAQVRDLLKAHMDSNDKLVVAVFGVWASYNLSDEVVQWLSRPLAV